MFRTLSVLSMSCWLLAISGCGGSPTSTNSAALVVFTDAAGGTSTSDVRDVDQELVRFDVNGNLIWAATGAKFGGYTANGNVIGGRFEVRFGTLDGNRRAFFTELGPGTICDIALNNGRLVILPTAVVVPR